jgi:hypothetical protein
MKKLIVALMLLSFVLAGTALAATDNLPKSLKGVDVKASQKVTDKEAQAVKGAYQANVNPFPGTCRDACTSTCVPKLYLSPGPHK